MVRTDTEDGVIVDEVVAALTGPVEGQTKADLRAQVERAASEFDAHTADSFCRALLAHLTEDPTQVRGLEALVVLGLAHPELPERHRIPIAREGRRLAVLLEKQGDAQRAQSVLELLAARVPEDRGVDRDLAGVMRRNGNLDRLVERHLRRAEEAIRDGQRKEAVRWLSAVLALDPSRRDVARMIRDLRYADSERRRTWIRRAKLAAVATVASSAIAAFVWRELDLDQRYRALPDAPRGDLAAMQARLTAIDAFVDEEIAWLGLLDASRERAELRREIGELAAERGRAERAVEDERLHREAAADAARARGRLAAEQRDFENALAQFRAALAVAPEGWTHRERVAIDVQALAEWQAQHGEGRGSER